MEFSRQDYWSGWPFLPPGELPDPGIEPGSLALQADSLPAELPGKPLYPQKLILILSSFPLLNKLNPTIIKCIIESLSSTLHLLTVGHPVPLPFTA